MILDETRMTNFPIALPHPCIYERDNIRVLEGVVELRTRPVLA